MTAARTTWRRLLLVTAMTASTLMLIPAAADAAPSPPGNENWIVLDGTCNGQPAQLLDPKGGNTAFLVGGSVRVGMHFRATNVDTGEVLKETFNGRGIDEDRLFYCTFLFEDVETPTGAIDILFEVWGLPTPQGPQLVHPSTHPIASAVVTAAGRRSRH